MRDIENRWAQDFHYRDRCLRIFFKPWAVPYHFFMWGLHGFGAGPIGCMYWPKRRDSDAFDALNQEATDAR